MKPAFARPIAGACLSLLAGCGVLFLPSGEATTKVTATVSIDGQIFSGSSVWLTKTQTQNGWPDSGINYRTRVLGDAVVFEIGNGAHLFLHPNAQAMRCADEEHPEAQYRATALSLFQGPCDATPWGTFTYQRAI